MTRRTILLEALASTPNDINRLIRPLDGVRLRWLADWNTSSPTDIIDHLLISEKIYQEHIHRIIGEYGPGLPSSNQSNDAQEDSTPINHLGRAFQRARSETLRTLEAISPGEWQRVAHLEPHGRISLRFLTQRLVEHDIEYTGRLVESVHFWRSLQKNGGLSE